MTHHEYLVRVQALVRASYAGRIFVWKKVWADALVSAGILKKTNDEDLTFQELFAVHFWVVEKIQLQLENTSTWLARFNQAKEREEIVTDGQPFTATAESKPDVATMERPEELQHAGSPWPGTPLLPRR